MFITDAECLRSVLAHTNNISLFLQIQLAVKLLVGQYNASRISTMYSTLIACLSNINQYIVRR
jgi:hypothetical protein